MVKYSSISSKSAHRDDIRFNRGRGKTRNGNHSEAKPRPRSITGWGSNKKFKKAKTNIFQYFGSFRKAGDSILAGNLGQQKCVFIKNILHIEPTKKPKLKLKK